MSTASYQPLLNLPEPQKITAQTVDYPEEILFENKAALNEQIPGSFYFKLISFAMVLFIIQVTIYISAISPLTWLIILIELIYPGSIYEMLRSLDTSVFELVSLVFISTFLGAALMYLSIRLGLRKIYHLRPRSFDSEETFQKAVGNSIAKVFTISQLILFAWIPLSILLPIRSLIKGYTFNSVSSMLLMLSLIYLSHLMVVSMVRKSNILRLQPVSELRQSIAAAPNAREFSRLLGIMQVYDRRHLPPSPTYSKLDFAARNRSRLLFLKAISLPTLISVGILIPDLHFVGFIASINNSYDYQNVQASRDFPWNVPIVLSLCALIWIVLVGFIVTLACKTTDPRKYPPRDLRVFPNVKDRLAVNDWERKVLNRIVLYFFFLSLLIWVILTAAIFLNDPESQYFFVSISISVTYLVIWTPIALTTVKVKMNNHLRDVFYGPATNYALRQTPIAAVVPNVGNRSDLEKSPLVEARRRAELAEELSLKSQSAKAPLLLPDFGIRQELAGPNAKVWLNNLRAEQAAENSSLAIPSHLNELEY